jgi:hypothetical protein
MYCPKSRTRSIRPDIDCTPLSMSVLRAPINVIELLLSLGGTVPHEQLMRYAASREGDDRLKVLNLLPAVEKTCCFFVCLSANVISWPKGSHSTLDDARRLPRQGDLNTEQSPAGLLGGNHRCTVDHRKEDQVCPYC